MKVVFCIPALTGEIKTECHQSLVATYRLLNEAKIPYEEFVVKDCPYLPVARAILVAMFMADPEATDLFFIDWDLKFDASSVLKILQKPQGIVVGIYPLKRDDLGWPVVIKTSEDRIPMGQDGLIEGLLVPVGFGRIKRIVFEKLAEAYPELKYEESIVRVMGAELTAAYDFFGMGVFGTKFKTEDYAFCQRWRDMGGRLWVYPDIDFEHVGSKAFTGNYHRYLLHLPGGAREHLQVERAASIEGWMSISELEWLAEQASQHKRIVELGSCFGRSTRALADNTKGTIFAVDNWQGPPELDWSPEKQALIEPEFRKNLADHIAAKRVEVVNANHGNIPAYLRIAEPDMVFIDGAHDFNSVERDIRAWEETIQPHGLLCGHDFDRESVRTVVKKLLPGAQGVSGTSLWFYQVPAKDGK